MRYAKGNWLWPDLNPLYNQKTKRFSQIPDNACRILAGMVDRLRARATRLEQENIRMCKEIQKLKNKQP